MNLTLDQLSYTLERKFINIEMGRDVQIACTAQPPNEVGEHILNNDAWITEWRLPSIPCPTVEDLEQWWLKLEEQYHSSPDRPDSKMKAFLNRNKTNSKPTIIINNEI